MSRFITIHRIRHKLVLFFSNEEIGMPRGKKRTRSSSFLGEKISSPSSPKRRGSNVILSTSESQLEKYRIKFIESLISEMTSDF